MKITLKDILRFVPLVHNLKKIRKEDEEGLLYSLDYTGDYYPLLSVMEGIIKTGCTVFTHHDLEGNRLLGRNFDLRHYYTDPESGKTEITGLITVLRCKNPKAKYESIGLCDAIYLDPSCRIFHRGSFDRRDKNTLRALMLPFLTMDGVNEKGLAVSVLFLNTDNSFEEIEYRDPALMSEAEKENLILLEKPGELPDKMNGRLGSKNILVNTADRKAWKVLKGPSTHQADPNKRTLVVTALMRMMLDSCETCEEAAALAETVNIVSPPAADYHVMVTDLTHSVMLEWIDNKLTVEACSHAANFYNNRADHFGYGYDRDAVLAEVIEKHPEGITEEACMQAMERASQNILVGKNHSYTQWSAVYNLNRQTVTVAVHSDYEKLHSFALKKA